MINTCISSHLQDYRMGSKDMNLGIDTEKQSRRDTVKKSYDSDTVHLIVCA